MMKSTLVIERERKKIKFFLYSSFLSYPCLKRKPSKFSNSSFFQKHLSSDRLTWKEFNDPPSMVVWGLFLEIWWSEIFAKFSPLDTVIQKKRVKIGNFLYLWIPSDLIEISVGRVVMGFKWFDRYQFLRYLTSQVFPFAEVSLMIPVGNIKSKNFRNFRLMSLPIRWKRKMLQDQWCH